MSVYVDRLWDHGWILHGGRVDSCHLIADTVKELKKFGLSIGMEMSWIQGVGELGRVPHFDLTKVKRIQAVKNGAKEIGGQELCRLHRRLRNTRKEKADAR